MPQRGPLQKHPENHQTPLDTNYFFMNTPWNTLRFCKTTHPLQFLEKNTNASKANTHHESLESCWTFIWSPSNVNPWCLAHKILGNPTKPPFQPFPGTASAKLMGPPSWKVLFLFHSRLFVSPGICLLSWQFLAGLKLHLLGKWWLTLRIGRWMEFSLFKKNGCDFLP